PACVPHRSRAAPTSPRSRKTQSMKPGSEATRTLMTESMRELSSRTLAPELAVAADVQLPPVASAMALIAGELEEVEHRLGELLHSTFAIIPRIGGHLTFAGGKRFRPMLTLLAAQAVRYRSDKRITVAAAGEL